MQHRQATIGMPPQCLPLQVDRRYSGDHRPHALAQQVEERLHATAGLARQRVALFRLPRQCGGVVIRSPGTFDALVGLVAHGDQQRGLACGKLAQLFAVQGTQRGVAVEHPQHRVARRGRRAIRLADP